jgi:hypothetical protein
MHKNATKCKKTQSKWCINKHGASKIIDTFETYQKILLVEDGVREEPRDFPMHIAGQPMLTKEMLANAGGAIVNLHDNI